MKACLFDGNVPARLRFAPKLILVEGRAAPVGSVFQARRTRTVLGLVMEEPSPAVEQFQGVSLVSA